MHKLNHLSETGAAQEFLGPWAAFHFSGPLIPENTKLLYVCSIPTIINIICN